jgi:hypothetical protein
MRDTGRNFVYATHKIKKLDGNPDVWVDKKGNVYPKGPGGKPGD